jgi:hypothetical protein
MKSRTYTNRTMLRWLFILGVYAFSLVSTYTAGQKHMFYLLLAQIPFVFLCWGLSRLISGGTIRDIAKHLTDEERAESTRLAQSYGGRMGLFVAGPFAVLCTWLHMSWGIKSILPYVGLFCVVMALAAPFMFRNWKKMRAFMLSTDYARKQQGISQQSTGE